MTNRWQEFRCLEESIPTTNLEAAYFIGNVKLHVRNTDKNWAKTWQILNEAHIQINASLISERVAA